MRQSEAHGKQSSDRLKLAFVGRCERAKGVHVLVEAVQGLSSSLAIEVYFFGPYWETKYGEDLRRHMSGDKRFHKPELHDRARLRERMQSMDLCVVPSIWGENAPLTVLESFAVGVPVIASRIGGLPEMIRDGVDGVLFEPSNAGELCSIVYRLATNSKLLSELKHGVAPPRTMDDLTSDMISLYQEMLGEEPVESSARRKS
jgi:glycosyltransferase involved in cell wall biosynthesis